MRTFIKTILLTGVLICAGYAYSYALNVNATNQNEILREQYTKTRGPLTVNIPTVTKNIDKEEQLISDQMRIITGDMETVYLIVPGDVLQISFNHADEVKSGFYQLAGDGTILMPFIGKVYVAEMNRAQVTNKLNRELKKYIRYPNVKIGVNNTGRVIVLGAVRFPTVMDLKPNLTAMEAIMLAGGFDPAASKLQSVLVLRGSVDNPIVLKCNLKKLIRKGVRTDNINLKPGDIIYIPTTFVSTVEGLINRVMNQVYTWYGLGGQNFFAEGDPWFGPVGPKKGSRDDIQIKIDSV